MTGTNETDWAYLLTLAGLPVLFAVVMAVLYIYTRRRRKGRSPAEEGRPVRSDIPLRPTPPD